MHQAAQQTLAELRVLFAIVEGWAPHVAGVPGIGLETIKTHIYEKTGASPQVDLAKIVAGFSSALIR